MPLVRDTPVTPPARPLAWIDAFRVEGLAPGGALAIAIEWKGVRQIPDTDPAQYESLDTLGATYTGAEAVAILTTYASTVATLKSNLYQILIDKGLEAGTVT